MGSTPRGCPAIPGGTVAGGAIAAVGLALLLHHPGALAADRDGARSPRRETAAPASVGTDHWSLRPVRQPATPCGGDPWIATPVDGFILERLRRRGLRPSPEAAPRTLVRRAFLVLHGLPPDPRDVERYIRDRRPDRYERLIDRLLASPRFGERWARHWLDVARYAESNGFETNRPRPHAYPYRDYVIAAFNGDTPYDRFIVEQIAGDAIGVDAGTGFLVAGPYDIVRSPNLELTLMQRANELDDFVNATSTAFLGLTVACARCHDHKFDPITQRDYYAMTAVFAGVTHGDRTMRRQPTAAELERLEKLRKRIAGLRADLASLHVRPPVNARRNVERFDPVEARYVRFTIQATSGAEPCIDELEIWSAAAGGAAPRNVALASFGSKATASGTLPGYAIHKLEHINDGRYGNSHSWISSTAGSGWVEIELPRPITIDRIEWGRDRSGRYTDRLATRYRIEVATRPGRWHAVASSDDRLPPGRGTHPSPPVAARLSPAESARVRSILDALETAEAELRTLADLAAGNAKVWAGTFRQPGPTHILYRGDPMSPRQVVPPDAIGVLGGLGLAVDAPEQERRLALARWIARDDNPLAARVMVNRLWQWVFGEGIVATPNDFGGNGSPPSHPELLDFLAGELVRSGWSMKHLLRLVVASNAFRQSSAPRDDGLAADAGNRLLWRFAPRRLEAEAIRDSILFASGVLDLRMGGPGFEVIVAQKGNVYNYVTKTSFTQADWRRSVYGHVIRGEQDGTFGAFDCPDGGQVAPKRPRSTTALQALNLLNGPFVLQQAELFARRLEREAGSDPEAEVVRAFAILYDRRPGSADLAGAAALVRRHGLRALCRALLNSNELLFVE